jgi:hypothetical protein
MSAICGVRRRGSGDQRSSKEIVVYITLDLDPELHRDLKKKTADKFRTLKEEAMAALEGPVKNKGE